MRSVPTAQQRSCHFGRANCTALGSDGGTFQTPCHQTSEREVGYRWAGLSKWLSRGLTFWWFDANWDFSVPPPMTGYSGHGDGTAWCGLSNRVWGSHLYFTATEQYNQLNPRRQHTLPPGRPMALSKFAVNNKQPGHAQQHHPAHHRYPVWWTGDPASFTPFRPYRPSPPPPRFPPFFARFHRLAEAVPTSPKSEPGQEPRQKTGERWDKNGQNAKTKIAARKRVEGRARSRRR